MSDKKRFFSLCNWSYDYTFHTFEAEEDAQADIQALADAARAAPDGLDEVDELVWGEIRGTVGQDGQLIPLPTAFNVFSLRAEVAFLKEELAAFRARVAAVLAELQTRHAQHRLVPASYNRERAEAFGDAVDLLEEALTVGGEE